MCAIGKMLKEIPILYETKIAKYLNSKYHD